MKGEQRDRTMGTMMGTLAKRLGQAAAKSLETQSAIYSRGPKGALTAGAAIFESDANTST